MLTFLLYKQLVICEMQYVLIAYIYSLCVIRSQFILEQLEPRFFTFTYSSLYSMSTITSYSESNEQLMKTFFLHRSRDSQITQEREKIILYPSFCVHARLCPIITLPRFISSQRLLVVVFTPIVQLPPDPLSFDFLARDCRQGQLQMHPHEL